MLGRSAFQARFLKRCAVAFRSASGEEASPSCWTMAGTKPAEEQRYDLMLWLPKVRLVRAMTA